MKYFHLTGVPCTCVPQMVQTYDKISESVAVTLDVVLKRCTMTTSPDRGYRGYGECDRGREAGREMSALRPCVTDPSSYGSALDSYLS